MANIGRLILGLGLLSYAVLRGAKGLVVGVRDYSFRGVDLANGLVSLNLNFIIKNPLFVGLTLNRIEGDIYIQGQKAGFVNTTVNYYLSAWHTHIIPVVVNLDVAGLGAAAVANIMSGDIRSLTISFDGRIYVGDMGASVPVQIDLDYNDLTK